MADHDHSYKLLFSHAALVRDLLQGFVLESWVADEQTMSSINSADAEQLLLWSERILSANSIEEVLQIAV